MAGVIDRHDDAGVATLVAQLAGDAKAVAQAEIAVAKAKVGGTVTRYKAAAIFFAIAGVLAFGGFIALLVGLILTVSTLVGPGWATVIVVGVTLGIAAILGLVGKSRLAPPEVTP